MYYRSKCRARIITRDLNSVETIRLAVHQHTHPQMYPGYKKLGVLPKSQKQNNV